MLTRFTIGRKEKKIHPLKSLDQAYFIEIDRASKVGPPTTTVIAIPVYNYESQQIEIVTSSEFFKVFRDEGDFNINLYDYKVYYHMVKLPPGFLVGGKEFPQLIITKIGPTQDNALHTLPLDGELKEFAQYVENAREEWRKTR
jgi:hypothetical protein